MNIELSVVMPCLDEAETLAICIKKAQRFFEREKISGEVIIADNGSTDGSQQIAKDLDATVVNVPLKGYGSALRGGIEASNGKYIIMGDADDSYDFNNLMPYLLKLREGYDLVMGNRFKGGIKKGAMPFLHRYLGNPVLSQHWLVWRRSGRSFRSELQPTEAKLNSRRVAIKPTGTGSRVRRLGRRECTRPV